MKPILELLGASDNTFHYARQYAFCVIVLGGIPTVLSNVMSNLLRSVSMSKEAGFGIMMGGIQAGTKCLDRRIDYDVQKSMRRRFGSFALKR